MTDPAPRLLITRPREDARALAETLRHRGAECQIEPLLEIIPRGPKGLDLDGVAAILLTSANGARALARTTERRDLALFAVGPATAAAAGDAGFTSVQTAGGDVAALSLCVEADLHPHGGVLLHVSGSAIAGDLAGRLTDAGFTVRRAVLYEARPAEKLSDAAVAAMAGGGIDGVLLFSPRTAAGFVRLARKASLALDGMRALCLSHAVAREAEAAAWGAIDVAARPEMDALLALIKFPPTGEVER